MSTKTLSWTSAQWRAETFRISKLIECKKKSVGMEHLSTRWSWNESFTRRMGDARPDKNKTGGRMRFSKPLWPAAAPAQRDETVLHELAHVIVECNPGPRYSYGRNGRRAHKSHDNVFKSMLVRLGGTGARTHEVNRDHVKRKTTRFSGECPGCSNVISFGKAMRTRWLRQRQIRVCRRCHAKLDMTWAAGAKRVAS